MPLPSDYLERVYAGVIGKVVGVYLGRPFEGWPREKILSDLGHVRYYVHEKAEYALPLPGIRPLVVTDDDVSGTFMAVRALEEHGIEDLTAEKIGKTWLNNIVEDRSVFSWGGKGLSTEHTAYLNLKHGIPGGLSGTIETNGKAIAEQIGGEIFIDAFPMCTPGNPDLAARFAEVASSVSHGGEAVYGAIMWACMEAEAFISRDIDHLIDIGLRYIPQDSMIATSVADVRLWAKEHQDWEKTLLRIEEKYGNGRFPGACPVIPNHALKIMSLIYGGHSFHEGIHIIVTVGWDTDSNGGNMGALLGIMHGLSGFEDGPDWRGPLADRAIMSSADPGYSINNCTRIAYDIANSGRRVAGQMPLEPPKNGAQFHFSLPGSVQGFRTPPDSLMPNLAKIEQGQTPSGPALAVRLENFSQANHPIEVMTDTFMPEYLLPHSHYELQASPMLYPGQKVETLFFADQALKAAVTITLLVKVYGPNNKLLPHPGPSCILQPGKSHPLAFTIPDAYSRQPIQSIGFILTSTSPVAVTGSIYLDYLRITGSPRMTLSRPLNGSAWPGNDTEAWLRAWVNDASTFPYYLPTFTISKSEGEGGIYIGTRDWRDYKVTAKNLVNHTAGGNGVAVRVRGLRRWYAILMRKGEIVILKAMDEERKIMDRKEWGWKLDEKYVIGVEVRGDVIRGYVNGEKVLEARDGSFSDGGMGMIVNDGSFSVEEFDIEPVEE